MSITRSQLKAQSPYQDVELASQVAPATVDATLAQAAVVKPTRVQLKTKTVFDASR